MSPNEKTNPSPSPSSPSFITSVFGRDEVMQLLGEMLSQVKTGYPHPQRPVFSQAALAAIAAHRANLATLGTEIRGANSSGSIS
jgi:hypothetical protein